MPLESIEIARKIIEAATDKQASDIVLLDTREICSFADYLVIMSGESDRQIEAIREAIQKGLKGEAIAVHHCEGTAESGWLLLDVSDVVVHIFSPFERDYYQLDRLWENAPIIVKIL
ncbi:ribosome silencing factor [Chloroflexota bacterium]